MQNPARGKLFAEARQVYDGTLTTNYLNGIINREYNNLRCSWLLCGTMALWSLEDAELGSRFLDFVLLRSMDSKLETKIGKSAARSMFESMCSLGREENTQERPTTEAVKAKRMTGGYLEFLYERFKVDSYEPLMRSVYTEELEAQCNEFARFITYIRARPPRS